MKLTYLEAKALIKDLGICSAKEYTMMRDASVNLKQKLPSQPSVFYKPKWMGWNEFTGVNYKYRRDDIQQLQKIAIEMGIKSSEEWRLAVMTKKIEAPLFVSKLKGFSNWAQFLNVEKYADFQELISFTRTLGLRTQMDWRKWCRDNERPSRIPFDLLTHYKSEFYAIAPSYKKSFWHYIFAG